MELTVAGGVREEVEERLVTETGRKEEHTAHILLEGVVDHVPKSIVVHLAHIVILVISQVGEGGRSRDWRRGRRESRAGSRGSLRRGESIDKASLGGGQPLQFLPSLLNFL